MSNAPTKSLSLPSSAHSAVRRLGISCNTASLNKANDSGQQSPQQRPASANPLFGFQANLDRTRNSESPFKPIQSSAKEKTSGSSSGSATPHALFLAINSNKSSPLSTSTKRPVSTGPASDDDTPAFFSLCDLTPKFEENAEKLSAYAAVMPGAVLSAYAAMPGAVSSASAAGSSVAAHAAKPKERPLKCLNYEVLSRTCSASYGTNLEDTNYILLKKLIEQIKECINRAPLEFAPRAQIALQSIFMLIQFGMEALRNDSSSKNKVLTEEIIIRVDNKMQQIWRQVFKRSIKPINDLQELQDFFNQLWLYALHKKSQAPMLKDWPSFSIIKIAKEVGLDLHYHIHSSQIPSLHESVKNCMENDLIESTLTWVDSQRNETKEQPAFYFGPPPSFKSHESFDLHRNFGVDIAAIPPKGTGVKFLIKGSHFYSSKEYNGVFWQGPRANDAKLNGFSVRIITSGNRVIIEEGLFIKNELHGYAILRIPAFDIDAPQLFVTRMASSTLQNDIEVYYAGVLESGRRNGYGEQFVYSPVSKKIHIRKGLFDASHLVLESKTLASMSDEQVANLKANEKTAYLKQREFNAERIKFYSLLPSCTHCELLPAVEQEIP